MASIRNIIAIVYDGAVYSAPMVSAHITDGNAVINGQKDYDESKQLASESIIPMASVWAKPLIVPEPRKYSTAAAISVVTLPSTIAESAFSKPF